MNEEKRLKESWVCLCLSLCLWCLFRGLDSVYVHMGKEA